MTNTTPVFILNELVILPNQEIKIDLKSEMSKKIIKAASKNNYNKVLVIAPKNSLESSPSIEDFPEVGVIAKIKSKIELTSGTIRIVLRGQKRVKINKYYQNKETRVLKCTVEYIELPSFEETTETAIIRKLKSLIEEYIMINPSASNSILNQINNSYDLDNITDVITSFMPFKFVKKLSYMVEINPLKRATNLINDLQEEINISNIDKELDEKLQENLENGQREYILKEKLKEINNELGNNKEEEILKYTEKLNSLNLNINTNNKLLNEIKKYSVTSEMSPEASVIKNYLDVVLNLPWNTSTPENSDVKSINKILNETHYGLNEIKDRISEFVILKNKNESLKAPIICLIGPPGVGKTSIAMSIAEALGRKFYKMSVGGLNDSTELIGSRKTYLGAAPGKIMQGIIKTGANNPLVLIDEVDKMVKDYKGDPASTLLEILDETQNKYFTDNYIEEPFDLSKVMFILTANDEDSIPKTLKDRLEIIHISSYTIYEKIDIAKAYIIKDILKEYNIDLKVTKDVIEYIVTKYTKEPGVRELKRVLEKLIRKITVYETNPKSITMNSVSKYLGNEITNYLPKIRDYGIANTLACTSLGGKMSHVEVSKRKGTGKLIVTGNTGKELDESINVVLSYVLNEYEIDIKDEDVHVHFMSEGEKKDGASGGVSTAVAMLSLFERKVVDGTIGFTGELSLKGDILPVGGLREKLITAASEGLSTIYIPKANELDLTEVPLTIFNDIAIKMVSNFSEIYDALFR